MNHSDTSTPRSRKLFDALVKRGLIAFHQYSDGQKTVDIATPDASIYIEVDGIQHFTEPGQIIRDFKRSHYSDVDGYNTFYVTNQIIDNFLDDVADAIFEVVSIRSTKKN